MEAQPLQALHPADSGKGEGGKKSGWDKAWRMMVEGKGGSAKEGSGSPSINLGLGIGAGPVIKSGKPSFTSSQLKELEQQTLIFKYISAGLPVPLHLVLSIWKSVATSFAPANGGIYKQYPSFVGFSPQGFDYRNMMDPEPGRCRRTDGKKWRCSKDVVLDQKYCERHMHRGRQRSRKHVEASEIASPSDTTPPINNNNSENSNTNLSISVPIGLQLRTPSSNAESNTATTISTSGNNESSINVGDNKGSTTPSPATPTINITTKNKNHDDVDDGNGRNLVNDYNSVNICSKNGNRNIFINTVSRGFSFSPKSVLQVLGRYSPCFDYRVNEDPEPGRCRRTDGKKWRCSKNVVPDQKYCGRHMHRGAKRRVGASQPFVATAVATNSTCLPTTTTTTTIVNKADHSVNMDTNLSISIPEKSEVMTNDEKSTTSSSSSDTTSTAYTSNVSHSLALSP